MARRKEAKQFLWEQLEKLHKEEHVDDLMKAGRVDELEEIANELDFSGIKDFFKNYENLFLEVEEIPKGYHYELVFYFASQEDWTDWQIFDDVEEFIEFLDEIEEDVAQYIARSMMASHLYEMSLAELLP